jgi:adhesin transport system membrane fusion protein
MVVAITPDIVARKRAVARRCALGSCAYWLLGEDAPLNSEGGCVMMKRDPLLASLPRLDLGRIDPMLQMVILFLLALMTWACFANIEEQIRAQGKIITSSRSQVVQVIDGGALKEGAQVQAGDLLAMLDPVRFQASNDEIAVKVAALRATLERLSAELDGRELIFSEVVSAYDGLLQSQRELHKKRLQTQRQEIAGIQRSLDLAQEELYSLRRLEEMGDASRTEVLRAERQVSELNAQITNKRNQFRQEAQAEHSKTRGELEQTEQVLAQRKEALESTQVRAPMSGLVKNVRFTTLGAVLKPGDELLQIVPSDDPLVVEARVRPSDVAFLRVGMKANVKLDAYDYTLYGSMPGHVTYISPDTLEEDLRRDEVAYYRVHVQTNQQLTTAGKRLDVKPGMTASVEIITGDRSVANFVLKPLRRNIDQALHEP